jgi:hypothetical protein
LRHRFDFAFFHRLARCRSGKARHVSQRRLPPALFADFLFHARSKTATLKSQFALPQNMSKEEQTVKMPRRPQKTGGLLQERRGQMTHAGLALMAVRARLGPA